MSFFHRRLFRGRFSRGFTVVELIAVLAVLAVLVLIAVPGYANYRRRAEFTRLRVDARLLQEASIRYYGSYNEWPVVRPELSDEELLQLAEHRTYNIRLDEWNNLLELRQAIAEAEGKDPSDVKFYRIDYSKLLPHVRIRSDLNHFVLRNPAGEVFILYPAMSFTGNDGSGAGSTLQCIPRGPYREPAEGEIVIRTAEELAKIGRDPSYPYNGSYILMSDIDLEGFDYYGDGTGWAPIGGSTLPFAGSFDGNGFMVKNLYINRPGQTGQGLFGRVQGAVIENTAVSGVNITGSQDVGALVGYLQTGQISNCCSSGRISALGTAGGLAGFNEGIISGSISKASVTGGYIGFAGGIAGSSGFSSKIIDCRSEGDISGVSKVGGIAGSLNGEILNCHAVGSVSGEARVGGLVGQIASVSYGPVIRNSYFTGTVNISGSDSYPAAGG
jgi:prepilin-type N-terminal cleavage/methylation domain-containing protein